MSVGKGRSGPQTRSLLRARDGDLCCWCHEPMRFVQLMPNDPPVPDAATIEHIIPRAKGGSRKRLDNLALAHSRCNSARNGAARPPLPQIDARP